MTPHALVIGGAGFIGSHLCRSLLADGQRVTCLDNLSSGRDANIRGLHESARFTFIEANIVTLGHQHIPTVDQVYYLASRASPVEFETHPREILEANSSGLLNALEYAQATDARLVYTSTSEIYGDPEVHPQPESYTGNVDPRGPRSCYDESKRFGEMLTSLFRDRGVDVRTARIFNTYGPRMRPDDGRVIPTFITQALADRDLTVHGDGTQTRSFCYVSDLVRGLRCLMDHDDPAYDVYNLGSPDERSIATLAEIVTTLTETTGEISYTPLPADDPQRRQPCLERAQRDLEWEPTVSLETGLKCTLGYFRLHDRDRSRERTRPHSRDRDRDRDSGPETEAASETDSHRRQRP